MAYTTPDPVQTSRTTAVKSLFELLGSSNFMSGMPMLRVILGCFSPRRGFPVAHDCGTETTHRPLLRRTWRARGCSVRPSFA